MTTTRTALRDHLVASRIAGEVRTSRENNLENAGRMARGEEHYAFGLVPLRPWTQDEVFTVMVERCGISADLDHLAGVDTIDPDLTIAALERWRMRLAPAAAQRERVLLATGHPTGVLAMHLRIAAALRAAGAEVLVPELSWSWDCGGPRPLRVRAVNGVHLLASGGELLHTHEPDPMRAVLAALAEQGIDPPDLVVADHGWAGAAAEAGIATLGLADCNDPALFVAEHEGKPIVTVPLDDNVPPHLYDPLSAYVTDWRVP
ncbi:MAG: phosphatase [Actinobacteria bacterium]|nr:phosphatase [Actinomycetota bacterium]